MCVCFPVKGEEKEKRIHLKINPLSFIRLLISAFRTPSGCTCTDGGRVYEYSVTGKEKSSGFYVDSDLVR